MDLLCLVDETNCGVASGGARGIGGAGGRAGKGGVGGKPCTFTEQIPVGK